MAVRVNIPQEQEVTWSRVLGYLIWSMGQIEWQCYEWGRQIGGDSLKDRLIDYRKFARRHEVLISVIETQPWPLEKKKRAKLLWRKAKGFAQFRNIIAHSPVIMNQNYPGWFGVVDVHGMKGSHRRQHRIYFAPIVYSTATKMQALASDLIDFWNTPGMKQAPNQSPEPTPQSGVAQY